MPATFVIAGANLAGGTAAATLRSEGFDGRLVLIGEEPVAPYERPPLSKEFLRGEAPFEKALIRPADFWEAKEVECRLGTRVTRIDSGAREAILGDGDVVRYDKLLIATGLRNRRLGVPGAHLDGVRSLRTVADAEAIRAEMAGATKAVIVGMGFIGAEVAASLRLSGLEVEVIEPLPAPCYRALGPQIGSVVAAIHADHGVRMHFGESVDALEGAGRVERVVTGSGTRIDCDFVVVGVGTVPVTDLLDGVGVPLDNGVVVDEFCRAGPRGRDHMPQGDPDLGIYAAGDVANHFHPLVGHHVRVEHWQNAMKQGAAAARSMLGASECYDEVHWFWSDQFDANIQAAGHVSSWDDPVIRGDIEARSFAAFYLQEGRITAAIAINRGRDLRRCLALIKARAVVDPVLLADPDTDVRAAATT
ncbi:MAG TPA: FAD-dependent oxidoreductase [Actinomycetota bacterium]|nr:FAD-dependent oxidoreductase [Actinomycetota bacterium]